MVRYKRVELEEGVPVQFLGIYATRWPFDSGVEPTVGFIEDDEELEERYEREYGEWKESLRTAGERIEELEGQWREATERVAELEDAFSVAVNTIAQLKSELAAAAELEEWYSGEIR